MKRMQIAINFDIPIVGQANDNIVGSGVPVQLLATFKFIENGFYGNQVQLFSISDDGTETELITMDKSFGKGIETAMYQNLGENSGSAIGTQNNSELVVAFPLLRGDFYQNLAKNIAEDSDQNTIYTFRMKLTDPVTSSSIFDVTKKMILSSGVITLLPDSVISLQCRFAPAHVIITSEE